MSIVKDAFIEGRETDVSWDDSKSKKVDTKMQVFMDNIETLASRERHTIVPLQQICPTSGKVLRTFLSRLEAARWVVDNVLKRPDKNPLSIAGNMEMCIRAGWRSYGYYWKVCSLDEVLGSGSDEKSSGTKVFVVAENGGSAVLPSISEASKFIGVDRKTLSRNLASGKIYTRKTAANKAKLAQTYNPNKTTLTFKSVKEASRETGMSRKRITKMVNTGKHFNNYKIEIKR